MRDTTRQQLAQRTSQQNDFFTPPRSEDGRGGEFWGEEVSRKRARVEEKTHETAG
jgi:hypothetical protein